jgi:hypothetical protein
VYEQNLARPSRLAQVFVTDNIRQFLGTNTGLDRFFCQSCPSIIKTIVRSFFLFPRALVLVILRVSRAVIFFVFVFLFRKRGVFCR